MQLHHRKTYANQDEDNLRKALFISRLTTIQEHNQRYSDGKVTYRIGLNKFSDLTEEELHWYTHGYVGVPQQNITKKIFKPTNSIQHSEAIDWRESGIVPDVKDQGNCGSCWAFAAIGTIETHYGLYKKKNVSLSEQQLLDCATDNYGCSGGWVEKAYAYIIKNGIHSDQDYPYKTTQTACRYNPSKSIFKINDVAFIEEGNEEHLLKGVAEKGAISVAIDATGNFAAYQSGIYYNSNCSTSKLTHAVIIVGYGQENGKDYWLVRNSYSKSWGENGYVKMLRNKNNHCGIASAASFPDV